MAGASSVATTRLQALDFLRANPGATDDELYTFMHGSLPTAYSGRQDLPREAGPGQYGGGFWRTVAAGGVPFSDELLGILRAGGARGPDATAGIGANIAAERQALDAYAQRFPATAGMAQVASGAIPGVGTANLLNKTAAVNKLLNSTKLVKRVAGAATLGLGEGAVFGAGEGETLQERAQNALFGAGLGATAAGVLTPVVGGIGEAALGATRSMRGNYSTVSPRTEALRLINTGLGNDVLTPDAVTKAVQVQADVGTPLSVVDAAGDFTKQLLIDAQQVPGSNARNITARNFGARRAGLKGRLIDRLRSVLNVGDADVNSMLEQLEKARSKNAARAFAEALDAPPLAHPVISEYMRVKEVREAYEAFRNDKLLAKQPAPPNIYDAQGNLIQEQIPVAALHVVQQAVNDQINKGLAGATISKGHAQALRSRTAEVLDVAAQLNKKYGEARALYRDESAVIDSFIAATGNDIEEGFGRKIPNFKKALAADVAKWMDETRAAALRGDDIAADMGLHYQLGAYKHLREQVRNADNPIKFLEKEEIADKIKAIFPDEKTAERFKVALIGEATANESRKLARTGTALSKIRSPIETGADISLASAGAILGHKFAAIAALGRLMRGERTMTPAIADEVATMLSSTRIEDVIEAMQDAAGTAAEQRLRQAQRRGAAGGMASSSLGVYQRARDNERQ